MEETAQTHARKVRLSAHKTRLKPNKMKGSENKSRNTFFAIRKLLNRPPNRSPKPGDWAAIAHASVHIYPTKSVRQRRYPVAMPSWP